PAMYPEVSGRFSRLISVSAWTATANRLFSLIRNQCSCEKAQVKYIEGGMHACYTPPPMPFKLRSDYKPQGDQPRAIAELAAGLGRGDKHQTLLGVTGSGKTFTIANVVDKVQKPTLVIAHNKTLAGQLYGELKELFPENAVEFFVSYYDYYQPEAYVPSSDTYIEKDST